jgi:molecular chaperone DnaK
MVKEAEMHAEEDRRKREEIETRNAADSLAYSAEKLLRDNADKVPSELKSEIEGKIAQVRQALNGTDLSQIKKSMEELSASMQKIGQAVYGQTGGQPGPGEGGGGDGGGTVEGDFREV